MNNKKLVSELFQFGLWFILLCGTIYSAMLSLLFVMFEKCYYKIALCAFGFCIILSLFYFISAKLPNKFTIIKVKLPEDYKSRLIIFTTIYTIIFFLLFLFRILPS